MSDGSPLLVLLENTGLCSGSRIDERRVRTLSAGRLSDLGAQAAEITRVNQVEVQPGALAHSATLSLGGGTEPCSSIGCRTRHIDELVPFAALYSDRVFVHNFLSEHQHPPHTGYVPTLAERRQTLFDDLQVIQRVRPLIEAGLLVPVTALGDRCAHCIARGAFGAGAEKRLERERKRLARRFFDEMTVSVEASGAYWGIRCEAPEVLLEHGSRTFMLREPPEALRAATRVLNRAKAGEVVPLSASLRRKLGYHRDAAGDILATISFEMAVAQVLGTAYLSDTALPLEVLTAISDDNDLARRSSLVQKYLTTVVPFFGDMPSDAMVKLRQREPEAFLLFRQALNTALEDVKQQRSGFGERDARAIYSDVVAPQLARLDRAVKNASRDVLKDLGRSIAGWTGAISFGLYAGFVPGELLVAAKALGVTKVLADTGAAAAKLLSPEDAIRKEDFYFLWKVHRLARSRSTR